VSCIVQPMAVSPSAMVVLIDEAIAAKLAGATGGAIKRVSDASGITVEHYTLDELRLLRREYASLAVDAASSTGGIGLTLITNKQPGAAA